MLYVKLHFVYISVNLQKSIGNMRADVLTATLYEWARQDQGHLQRTIIVKVDQILYPSISSAQITETPLLLFINYLLSMYPSINKLHRKYETVLLFIEYICISQLWVYIDLVRRQTGIHKQYIHSVTDKTFIHIQQVMKMLLISNVNSNQI